MASDKTVPPNRITHEHQWQTWIEFTLASDSDNVQLAIDLVIGTVQTLNWPVTHLEQLKVALAKASQNVLEQSRLSSSATPLIIRVLISENDGIPPETGPAGHKPTETRPTDKPVQGVQRLPARGWGFFLVQKQGEVSPAGAGEAHHLIELFLYQERARHRKLRHRKKGGNYG